MKNPLFKFFIVSQIILLTGYFLIAPAFAETEIPIEGHFKATDETPLPNGWNLNPTYPGKVQLLEEETPEKEGQVLEITVGEEQNRVGLSYSSRLPSQPGAYEFRFYAKGDGELLLGISLWSYTQWVRMVGKATHTYDGDWQEFIIRVNVPQEAFSVTSKADTDSPLQIDEIQPLIFALHGTIQIANLHFFKVED